MQLFHEGIKRYLAVSHRAQGYVSNTPEQFPKRRPARKISAEDNGVHERPEHHFQLGATSVRCDCTDSNIFLPGIAVEQSLECRHQSHEQRGSLPPAQILEGNAEVPAQVQCLYGASKGLDWR